MSTKHFSSILAVLLLVFFLAACGTQTPATEPTDDTAPPNLSYESYMEELRAIEAFLNDRANNGFISNNFYTSPSEIDLYRVFYDGAGIKVPTNRWAKEEEQAVRNATGWHSAANYMIKIPYDAANAFLAEKCGLSLADFQGTIQNFQYVEAYDAFYHMHEDLNYHRINVGVIHLEEGGRYTAFYTIHNITSSNPTQRPVNYAVTLQKTDNGYLFISNTDDPFSKPNGVEEPFLSVLTGEKSFYNATRKTSRNISYYLQEYKSAAIKYLQLDIDADKKQELIVSWKTLGNQMALLILREENGIVVGHDLTTVMSCFNQDGSYSWTAHAPEKYAQGVSVLRLSENTYTSIKLWYRENYYSSSNSDAFSRYYVDTKLVPEEEFNAAIAGAADPAEWKIWNLD